jgi:hypothetical protein
MVGSAKARFVLECSARLAPQTNYRPQTFGGILQYTSRALAQFDDAERINKQKELIAACPFCDDHGFIKVHTTARGGHGTVRLCSHSLQIESGVGMPKDNIPPDAQNWSIRGDSPTNEKGPAEPSASP